MTDDTARSSATAKMLDESFQPNADDRVFLEDTMPVQERNHEWARREVFEVSPGFMMVSSRRAVDEALKQPTVFSSEGLIDMGNIRPMLPISVDPPNHLKYRKLLDPLFAPKRMEAIEDDVHVSLQPLRRLVRRTG